jgi:hypothetical protein
MIREEHTIYSVKDHPGGAFVRSISEDGEVSFSLYPDGAIQLDFDEAFRMCNQLRAGKYPRAVVVNLRGDEINPLPNIKQE